MAEAVAAVIKYVKDATENEIKKQEKESFIWMQKVWNYYRLFHTFCYVRKALAVL